MFSLPILKGFLVNSSFIVAIGAQNAFVIREGITKQRVFLTVIICSMLDVVLIGSGILGLGKIIEALPSLMVIIKWAGVFCLAFYGCCALRQVFGNSSLETDGELKKRSLSVYLLSLLTVILLNPSVYLDAVLIGTIGTQYYGYEKYLFVLGTCISSTAWFVMIGYGSRYFSDFLSKPQIWKLLNVAIAAIMFWMSASLLWAN